MKRLITTAMALSLLGGAAAQAAGAGFGGMQDSSAPREERSGREGGWRPQRPQPSQTQTQAQPRAQAQPELSGGESGGWRRSRGGRETRSDGGQTPPSARA
ncbi:MAG: hypothetical protein WAL33_02380, partial [Caulobacter sp.]